MTHREEVKAMLKWLHNEEWYEHDGKCGFILKKNAPPEAVESFKKWAAYQDSLGGKGYDYAFEK